MRILRRVKISFISQRSGLDLESFLPTPRSASTSVQVNLLLLVSVPVISMWRTGKKFLSPFPRLEGLPRPTNDEVRGLREITKMFSHGFQPQIAYHCMQRCSSVEVVTSREFSVGHAPLCLRRIFIVWETPPRGIIETVSRSPSNVRVALRSQMIDGAIFRGLGLKVMIFPHSRFIR